MSNFNIEFSEFPKIHRLNRRVSITEKIDGTNAQIYIDDKGEHAYAGSRTRWITPSSDNFGFARWVADHHDELLKLGPGSHFGEWWGSGIQRGYDLSERRFSLFNTTRWGDDDTRPACCHVIPIIASGLFTEVNFHYLLDLLRRSGSLAAPGFMKPEGIVVFHEVSNSMFKMTLDNDDANKEHK